ncbi:MAG: hypothetical protein ABIH23_32355 [bacterium]
MEHSSKPFQSPQMVEDVVSQFGAGKGDILITMRKCHDVPRFIQKVNSAHKQTDKSELRFGPPTDQLQKDAR